MVKTKEIKLCLAKAEMLVNKLKECEQFLASVDDAIESTYVEIEFRLSLLTNLNNEYEENYTQLNAVSTEKEEIMSTTEFLKKFIAVNMQAQSLINKRPKQPVSNETVNPSVSIGNINARQNVNARLPKLSVPNFYGDYINFTSYYEAFTALIHNNETLTDVERFMYLRDSLKGSASHLVANIQATGENYKIAFELLCERFNNVKLIVNNHVSSIFDLKSVTRENAIELRNLYDDLNKHLRALDNITITFDNRAIFVSHILMSKFDANTRREFSKFKPKEIPTLADIDEFLKTRCQILEEIEANKVSINNPTTNNNYAKNNDYKGGYQRNTKSNQQFKQNFLMTNNKTYCSNCKASHSLSHCPGFLSLSTKQKIDRVNDLKICKNCLYHSNQNTCRSRYSCQICGRKHHTLLHLEQFLNSNSNGQYSSGQTQINQTIPESANLDNIATHTRTTLSCVQVNFQQVILPTAIVQVRGNDNKWHKARLLLDSGSHIHLITEAMANKLQLSKNEISTKIIGINSSTSNSNSTVNIHIASLCNNYRTNLSCVIIQKIAENLPLNYFRKNSLNIPDGIQLADVNFNVSSAVDILIGASLFYSLLSVGQISLGKNKPILQKTVFGWIVSGDYNLYNKSKTSNIACLNLNLNNKIENNNSELEKSVERFWLMESVQPKHEISKLSVEERFCEQHFYDTVTQDSNGRFTVSIPYNAKLKELGDSKNQALDRFIRLEKTLAKNPELHNEYKKFMHEYRSLGHMKRVEHAETEELSLPFGGTINILNSSLSLQNIPEYYLPHHAVIKSSSLTTKTRVVFDGSAKTTTGISINDTQITGPVVQADLFSILLRFRQHIIALTGDIEKMYRQFQIDPKIRKLQQIFWRDSPAMPLEVYQLQTITYGTASASYLATKCLQHLANLNTNRYFIASQIIKNNFYMDDLLAGGDTIREVLEIKEEVTSILAGAGLPIRKFLSNNSEVLSTSLDSNSKYFTVPLGERENAKMLGISWNALSDVLQFSMENKFIAERNTKRTILSSVSQLFDPLGLIAPIIVKGKLLIQKLWQLNLTWDESITESLNSEWIAFKDQLSELNLLKIPRCVKLPNHIQIQLHGFSDSSSLAYGASIYLRCIDASHNISIRLLCSKSRVNPLRGFTIPRMELCAALLLAQLVQKVRESLTINFEKVFLWTDSTIVLHWINSAANKYKTFIANRIASIQELSNEYEWRHVRSTDNPADLVSRGTTIRELIENPIWFNGPKFLSLSQDQWPSKTIEGTALVDAEFKNSYDVPINLLNITTSSIFNRFSNCTRLQRVVAWILRFKQNVNLNRTLRLLGPLNTLELQKSLNVLVKLCQAESFSQELKMLNSKQVLRTTSSILSLNPFLDENNIIRVGGRIKNSDYSFNKKFPVLLPKDHKLTKLIFKQFHEKLLHCGAQQLLACIRENYWPISGRNSAKSIVHNCISCFKVNPKSSNPLMGNLPSKRLQVNMPVFHNVGIDYAGPILIKDRNTRGAKLIKAYICLFVCLVTRAIHIDMVTSLTTDAFIAVLKRFISRRGKPAIISSDNAKNFVGAANQLHELYKFLNTSQTKNATTDFLVSQGIKWEFIVPRAPHQGGIWEGGVKSMKLHIKRVLGNSFLNYEDLQTLLTQIEAVLNSRPLSPLSTDPSDLNPLTPGHFIIGKPLCALPEPNYFEVSENRLSRYQRIQRLMQLFWKRWSREVVPELQKRTKWFHHMPTMLVIGSVVLIQDDNLPPLQWCIGRVIEVHSSEDNIPRSATILTSNGQEIKRSVHKLCVLPGVQECCAK